MRFLLILILICAAVAGGWFWLNRDRSGEIAAAEARHARAKAALGMRTMLREHPVYDFKSIVLGTTGADRSVDFRSKVSRSGRMTPAYGQAQPICEQDLELAECWELTYLQADGQDIDLGASEATSQSESKPEVAEEQEPPAEPSEPATDTSATTSPSAEPAVAAPVETSVAQTENTISEPSAPPATHRVARQLINTRSGPGTQNPVVTQLQAGAELALLETQDGWGRFLLLSGAERGIEVWAAFSILEAL